MARVQYGWCFTSHTATTPSASWRRAIATAASMSCASRSGEVGVSVITYSGARPLGGMDGGLRARGVIARQLGGAQERDLGAPRPRHLRDLRVVGGDDHAR